MTQNPNAQTIAAAVYLLLPPGEHRAIFPTAPPISDKDDAIRRVKAGALSDNQRLAVFSYLYLYSRLQKLDINALKPAQSALSLPNGVYINLESVINQQRVDYIRKLFKGKGRGPAEVFSEPDPFIVKMIEDVVSTDIPLEKKKLKGLKASEYEHEGDRSGMELLKSQTDLGALVKKFNEYAHEKMAIVRLTGSNYQVTEKNLPHVHNALKQVCNVLDLQKVPPLYIEPGGINAYTIGTKTPIISINSGCLSLLTHDELLYILGHEVGHIKSGHFQYHSMAGYLLSGGETIASFLTLGLSKLFTPALKAPMYAWYRKSELTCDRAGLLACQNPEAAFTFFTKLAGYPLKYYSGIDPQDIIVQARAFEDLDKESFNQFAKFATIFDESHPWTIMRAKELDRWIVSGRYKALLNQKAMTGGGYGGGAENKNPNINISFNKGGSGAADGKTTATPTIRRVSFDK